MRRKITRLLLLSWLGSCLLPAAGPLHLGLAYNGDYSDNIFLNASGVKDYISRLQAELNVSLKRFNLYLESSADLYADNPGYNSFHIEPGIEYLHPLTGRNALYLGIGYSFLQYRSLYTDFNNSGPLFQAGIKLYITSHLVLKAGFYSQSQNYSNFPSFDFFHHTLFAELNRFFRTQTSLRLQTGLNYRYYPHIADSYDFGPGYNYYQNGAAHGKGSPGTGGHSRSPDAHTMTVSGIYALLGIDQGIGTRLGLSGEAELRESLRDLDTGSADILVKNAYILYPLNDDFLWAGLRLSLQLKAVLSHSHSLSLEARISYFDKNYPGVLIMDEEGNPSQPLTERADSQLFSSLKISKPVKKWNIHTHFSYSHNHSNDDYFSYNVLTISAGLGYTF
jgi:hypothetical protein